MKTRRTLIISAAIMALALIVTFVGVSAAWFGDIKHRESQRQLSVSSQRPMGEAAIDIESAASLNEDANKLVPAKVSVVNGVSWLLAGNYLLTGGVVPEGEVLRPDSETGNVKTAATSAISTPASVVPIYFPFSYGGTADSGAADGKKAIKIYIDYAYLTANSVADSSHNYIDDFYLTFTVVTNVTKNPSTGVITDTAAVSATATKDQAGENATITFAGLSGLDDSIYFVNDIANNTLYLLVQPDVDKYSVRVDISYKYLDEELNPATIDKTIKFGVHIEVINRAALLTAIEPFVPLAS